MEIESWFCNTKRITEMDGDGLYNIMTGLISLQSILNMVKMVNFKCILS